MAESPRVRAQMELRAEHSPFTRRVILPVQRFIQIEETAGGPLILAAAIALLWANIPGWLGEVYHDFWHTYLKLDLSFIQLKHSLKHWVNDALLPLFFFVIGLEIKRELVRGELSSLKRAALPVVVAIGGMVIPAAFYLSLNMTAGGSPDGWGIPVATDIAFALAILSLVGNRIPYSLKLLLLAFAAVDDIGGVLVIALFYSEGLNMTAVGVAALILAAIWSLKVMRVWYLPIYWVLGVAFWLAFTQTGVHATIAGVILGLLAPARAPFSRARFAELAGDLSKRFGAAMERWKTAGEAMAAAAPGSEERARHRHERNEAADQQDALLGRFEELTAAADAPCDRLSRLINPWVSYVILPIFALANAGVDLSPGMLGQAIVNPAALGVTFGLVLGKPVGCVGLTWIAVKLNLTHLPPRITWAQMTGIGLLAGIGFTVSLFIAELAFGGGKGPLEQAKLAIFAASVIAGVAGYLFLLLLTPNTPAADGEEEDEAH